MLGRRSLNLDLTSLDPEIERTLRRGLRNSIEMGDNVNGVRMSDTGEKILITLEHLGICLHLLQ